MLFCNYMDFLPPLHYMLYSWILIYFAVCVESGPVWDGPAQAAQADNKAFVENVYEIKSWRDVSLCVYMPWGTAWGYRLVVLKPYVMIIMLLT